MPVIWNRFSIAQRRIGALVLWLIPQFLIGVNAHAACKIPGLWSDLYAGKATINNSLTGSLVYPYCSQPISLAVAANGTSGFTVQASYVGDDCQDATFNLTFAADCKSASGPWVNADGTSGTDTWNRDGPNVTLTRNSLTSFSANGTPAGGIFDTNTTVISGGNIATVAQDPGSTSTSNPDTLVLNAPPNTGAPTPGGLATIIVKYTVNGIEGKNDTNTVATFGMSCYMVALESDYGTAPNACTRTRIAGVTYSGAVTNPNGLNGTYCKSFIANIRLQGTGQLNSGSYANYDVRTGTINLVTNVTGADGTPVVAGGSVARDRTIIPGRGVHVDVDEVADNLLANDTGGAIRGYRLDLFNGAGRAACANYGNPIGVGACQPAQGTTCPTRDFQ